MSNVTATSSRSRRVWRIAGALVLLAGLTGCVVEPLGGPYRYHGGGYHHWR